MPGPRLLQPGLVQAERLVGRTRLGAEGHVQAVPAVDAHHQEGEVRDFRFGQLAADLLVHCVGHAVRVQRGQRLGPFQRGALARAEQGGLTPDGDVVQAQFALAADLGLLDVHVQAEAATVDLRGADRHEIVEFADDGLLLQRGAEVEVMLGQFGGNLEVIQTLGHVTDTFAGGIADDIAAYPHGAVSGRGDKAPRIAIWSGPCGLAPHPLAPISNYGILSPLRSTAVSARE